MKETNIKKYFYQILSKHAFTTPAPSFRFYLNICLPVFKYVFFSCFSHRYPI